MTRVAGRSAALLAGASVLGALSCSSARISGGTVVRPGADPTGVELGRWKMADCHDAAGHALAESDSTVLTVRTIDGHVVLVDRHPEVGTVVVDNAVVGDDVRTFQVVLKPSGGDLVVREYRVPAGAAADGRFALITDVARWDDTPSGGFIARYRGAALTCRLSLASTVPEMPQP